MDICFMVISLPSILFIIIYHSSLALFYSVFLFHWYSGCLSELNCPQLENVQKKIKNTNPAEDASILVIIIKGKPGKVKRQEVKKGRKQWYLPDTSTDCYRV